MYNFLELNLTNSRHDGMNGVSLAVRTELYHDVREGAFTDQLLHICTQENFERISPEELRWKHQVVKGNSR